jgi:4-hydroxy-tetrahydrodipicolinate reductase
MRAVALNKECKLVGGIEPKGSPAVGADLGTLAGFVPSGVTVTDDPLELVARVDAILDFTAPAATVEFAGLAANARIVHVVGTTGLSDADEAAIKAAARHATIVKSGNMSLGVNALAALTRKLSEAIGDSFDIEVLEMHHRNKVDAPSGTALMLGRAAAQGRGVKLDDVARYDRKGHTGARTDREIGFATLRGGSVIGDHSVIFAGAGERIVLTHIAEDRSLFAKGAVNAALWARQTGKGPGLYSMMDVLGL